MGGESTVRGEIPFLAALGKFTELHYFSFISTVLLVVRYENLMDNFEI